MVNRRYFYWYNNFRGRRELRGLSLVHVAMRVSLNVASLLCIYLNYNQRASVCRKVLSKAWLTCQGERPLRDT